MNNDEYYLKLIEDAYSSKRQIADIAKDHNIKPTVLYRIKRKYKIKSQRFDAKMPEDIKNQMLDLYKGGKSSGEISKAFGYKTHNTVLTLLKRCNIKARKGIEDYTNYNVDVFKKIDNHDKAYILGLIYADGYVYREYRGVCIQLTQGDRYILERIAKIFGESASVIDIKCDYKRKKMPNVKDMSRLGVYSPKIASDLKALGVIRNKTYDLKMTNLLPKKYTYSFLRGVIDGDGTLGIAKTGNIWCQIVSKSESFADGLCRLPIAERLVKYYNTKQEIYCVRLCGGNKETIKFLRKMYKHKNNFYLERKYARVQDQIC